ncbi:coatomer subunit delta [Guillardia theta CCMP2712]|uniref:Coatomer subunit delta n=2 Tax=Guillardia theta TaxID=55529 RepID=L1IMA3_GUITC|nr:coatomer subunit delta [Guillardia theta CCMP2712]EKX36920.1 coatomer subunit delta [Guillardia theta CCMP2712]|mmetsp:Transcript_27662/g.90115  ORF Transcript_27662/g.90115 Transcript_27662/m.90115 type:complete len:506 (+) Transcript_27662:77-1594(+)|eukprot:XP_005823900.1 coatomer subunit delta [Guillardia theta CCMP2712]
MVVLSASLTSKTGKPLVARQFVEMNRIRIEGLLAGFSKLVDTKNQHTYVETEVVRYVYQPMEELYLLLITNKSSNIIEDLETLRLLAKLVPEFCPSLDEEGVKEHCFELILAFDEVLAMGHRETINLQQVKTALEMESHEEKLHNMIRQSKINEAKEEAKKKAAAIDSQKKGKMGGISGMSSSGIASAFADDDRRPMYDAQVMSTNEPVRKTGPPKGKGMQLGSKTKQSNDVLKALEAEDELMGMVSKASAPSAQSGGRQASAPSALQSVTLKIEEKLLVRLTRDGTLENLEVRGELKMCVNDPEAAYTRVQVTHKASSAFQFKTHPNINRGLWTEESVLSHRDQAKSFPVGNELGVLKWRLPSGSESMLPISVSCWPSAVGNNVTVNLEYESASHLEVSNLRIVVPCPSQATISDVAEGDARYLSKNGTVEWRVELVDDSNRSGSLEFSVNDCDPESLFPIQVTFVCKGNLAEMSIAGVSDARSGKALTFSGDPLLEVEEYQIQ